MSAEELEQFQESVNQHQQEYDEWSRLVEERLNSCDPRYPDLEDSPPPRKRGGSVKARNPADYGDDELPF